MDPSYTAIAAPHLLDTGLDGYPWDAASATIQKESDILPHARILTYTLDIPEEEHAARWAS